MHSDGTETQPFGEHPLGYVVYTNDGRMITTISHEQRAAIGGELLSAPEAARADAFASFMAYSGTVRVEGQQVVHLVEMSLFPDWVGTEQRRDVALSEDGLQLTLSVGLASENGRVVRHSLRWTRVPDGTI